MNDKRYTDDGLRLALRKTANGIYSGGLTEVKHIAGQALDTIDRLRAINAEYAALATEYQNSDMGENELAGRICAIRDRNALAAPADGSADADADAADGSEVAK
jgi:hypothetical protein